MTRNTERCGCRHYEDKFGRELIEHCDTHHAEWAERHAAARESADITERAALIDAGRGHLVRP